MEFCILVIWFDNLLANKLYDKKMIYFSIKMWYLLSNDNY